VLRNGVRADFLSISDDSRNLSANSLPVIECSDVTDLGLGRASSLARLSGLKRNLASH
jgi:hypothetical protein